VYTYVTRTPEKSGMLEDLGAQLIVADVINREGIQKITLALR
jgi:hypothetical protein